MSWVKAHLDLTPEGKIAKDYGGCTIIAKGFKELQEIWGSVKWLFTILVYTPEQRTLSVSMIMKIRIIDFKQSNKPKRKEWIQDYFMQLGAYAMAHNYVHKTEITQGVILMCTPDNYFQKFQVKGKEFVKYQHQFLRKGRSIL